MANTVGMREALAFIAEHSETFASAVKKNGEIDVAALESLAIRGDALAIIDRKFEGVTEESRGTFLDTMLAVASDVAAGCVKSGTSGNQQFAIVTPHGKLSVVLSDQPKP